MQEMGYFCGQKYSFDLLFLHYDAKQCNSENEPNATYSTYERSADDQYVLCDDCLRLLCDDSTRGPKITLANSPNYKKVI